MFGSDSWKIEGEPIYWFFAITVLAVAVFLGFRTWIRMKKNRKIALLEIFRILIIATLLFTLFDPERVERIVSDKKSQIICLRDVSDSMQTQDIRIGNEEPIERSTWSEQFLQEDWIKNLESNATILVKNFSSPAGTQATDITEAIHEALDEGDSVKAILILTDGDANTGSSVLTVAGKSRALSVPVYSLIAGYNSSLPDLVLDEIFAPSFVLQEERVMISWQATNNFQSPQKTSLTLFSNGEKVLEKPVSFMAGETISGNLSWLPEQKGEIEFEIILQQVKGETYKTNNLTWQQ